MKTKDQQGADVLHWFAVLFWGGMVIPFVLSLFLDDMVALITGLVIILLYILVALGRQHHVQQRLNPKPRH